MVGLELPFAIVCRESDRGNLRTIVALLKKTRVLSLDRITVTWPVLQLLNTQWRHFRNIKGLRLEFNEDQEECMTRFMAIPDGLLESIEELALYSDIEA